MPRKFFKYDCEHYPRNPQEMLGIMAVTFGKPKDDPELKLACRMAAKTLKEDGHVIFFTKKRDPLIFKLAKRGSKPWLNQRTPSERQAFYDQMKQWSKRKKKKKEATVGWKVLKR